MAPALGEEPLPVTDIRRTGRYVPQYRQDAGAEAKPKNENELARKSGEG